MAKNLKAKIFIVRLVDGNKNFLKNLAICVIGFLIWIVIFVEIIEPQKTKEKSQQIQTVVREAGK